MSTPPIREPWRTDKEGKLVSLPWILWLQQLATAGQVEEAIPGELSAFSTVGTSALGGTSASPDDIASLAAMVYNPSSSTVPSNEAEMMAWMSF